MCAAVCAVRQHVLHALFRFGRLLFYISKQFVVTHCQEDKIYFIIFYMNVCIYGCIILLLKNVCFSQIESVTFTYLLEG